MSAAETGCELSSGLFYCWSLLCNNNTAINFQTFTSSRAVTKVGVSGAPHLKSLPLHFMFVSPVAHAYKIVFKNVPPQLRNPGDGPAFKLR